MTRWIFYPPGRPQGQSSLVRIFYPWRVFFLLASASRPLSKSPGFGQIPRSKLRGNGCRQFGCGTGVENGKPAQGQRQSFASELLHAAANLITHPKQGCGSNGERQQGRDAYNPVRRYRSAALDPNVCREGRNASVPVFVKLAKLDTWRGHPLNGTAIPTCLKSTKPDMLLLSETAKCRTHSLSHTGGNAG